ncbi:MAG: DUF3524 domain-containing protein [bacterium]|nr:DUF3524 domain-containing protein [bacterium]
MQLEIALIEPFFSGSHKVWSQSLNEYSKHNIDYIAMPGRHWKWRMHGGAITTARLYSEKYHAASTDLHPRLILATDMLDLTTFLALTRRFTAKIPAAVYFHESQFSYPVRSVPGTEAKPDEHYPFINYASALAADRIYFNSHYHRDDFLKHCREFPGRFPDFREESAAESLAEKSRVLPLGLEAGREVAKAAADEAEVPGLRLAELRSGPPVLLWNHRREHDKNPEDFFAAMIALAERGCDFRLVVLGQSFRETPPIFAWARERLGERIVRFESAESRADYFRWLLACDLLPVTSKHDFFGAAVIEAMAAGCYPMLPRRLAYAEHVDGDPRFMYSTNAELVERLEAMLKTPGTWRNADTRQAVAAMAARYDWPNLIADYDREFEDLAQTPIE